MARQGHPFDRAAPTGKRVAVVGAGPAGLSCAHRLAKKGHDVALYDARAKAGGLNEFGIAAYKATNNFAAREVDWLLGIGGITIETGRALGADLSLEALKADFDAVFLAVGLGGVNALRTDGEDKDGVRNAVDFISELRQAGDLTSLPVGRNVVVIGGGMTAVDAAVQSKLLGADTVTIAYRRGRDRMAASRFEQDLAASKGVRLLFNVQPKAIHGNGAAVEIELEYTAEVGGTIRGTGETLRLPADQVFKAIGQTLTTDAGLKLEGGKIAVAGAGRTSVAGVWAGGDCASGGDDLTVTAVAEGRDAAEDIHATLMGKG
jgi:glutamate synthase (NADPH/NADH) small chain